jgi:exonuclease VII large subunit
MFLLLLFTFFQIETYSIDNGYYVLVDSPKDGITFSSYRLSNPERIVLEINGTFESSFSNLSTPVIKVEKSERKDFTRVIFYVEEKSFYTVLNRGNQILIGFRDKLFLDHEDFDAIAEMIEKQINIKIAEEVEPEPEKEIVKKKTDESELVSIMMQELEINRQRVEEEKRKLAELEKQRIEEEKRKRAELERQRIEEEKQKLAELEKQRIEEEKRKLAELERQRIEEEKQKLAELERQRIEEEKQKLAELEKQRIEEEKRRRAEIEKIESEKERKRQLALEKQRIEEEKRRLAELERQRIEEEKRRLAELERQRIEEEKRRLAELERQRIEEEKRRLAELERQRIEEEKRKLAELERQRIEEEKRRLAELERQRIEEEKQKLAELERQRIEEEKRRLAELAQRQEKRKFEDIPQKKAVRTEDGTIRQLPVVKVGEKSEMDEKISRLPVRKVGERGALKNLLFRKFAEFSRVSLEITGDIDYQFREIKGGFVIDVRNFGKIPQHVLNIIDTRAFNAEVEYIYPKRVDDIFKIYIKADPGTAVRKSEDGNIINLDFFVPTIQ